MSGSDTDRGRSLPRAFGRRARSGLLAGVLVAGAIVGGGATAASAQTGASVVAWLSHERFAILPAPAGPGVGLTQSVPAAQTLTGQEGWRLGLTNTTDGVDVIDPAVTVDSGFDPSLFPGLTAPNFNCPAGVVRQGMAFPFTWTDTSPLPGGPLAPAYFCNDNQMLVDELSTAGLPPTGGQNPPLSFAPGFDSSWNLDTTLVLPGGTQQMTVSGTVRGPSATELVLRSVVFATPETATSITPPPGVPDCAVPDPGTAPCIGSIGHSDKAAQVNIEHPAPGVVYRFGAVFTNDGSDPVNMIPAAQVGTTRPRPLPTETTGAGLRITDAALDAGDPGRGVVEFSAGQPADWALDSEENSIVEYSGGTYAVPAWPPSVGGGHFVIGDGHAVAGEAVTFWGTKWARTNGLPGSASTFRGFADSPSGALTCGARWSGGPGYSAAAPRSVPLYMPVIVTASAGAFGGAVSGTVTAVAIVRTDPGYSPGGSGTGTVVAVLPC